MNTETTRRYIDLERLYKERDEIERKIIEHELVMQEDGIWCKRCGNFVPIYKSRIAFVPEHVKHGLCYMCARERGLCNNRDRLMELIGNGTVIDLKPSTPDGDIIEWLIIKASNGYIWKLITKNGKLLNLRHEIRKVRK